MDLVTAAALMGCPPAEIADVFDAPCGPVIVMRDDTSYIDVDSATPDAAGKHGLMYLNPPMSETGADGQYAYLGDFPVFAPHPDDDSDQVRVTEPAAVTDERTVEPAVEVDPREVRAWAKANHVDCPARGKVPADVVDAYLAATGGV